uniref:Uncharacterized protein n=1 Tax=viral metagenome TaxID=1070528 RepID=A0A6C0JQD0_9ZZZZ
MEKENLIKLKGEIENIISSKKINILPPFYVKDYPQHIKYTDNCKVDKRLCLHLGQRKLFNGLLYYLSTRTITNESNFTCLYIGAAPGHNISGIAKLFPTVNFILYDGQKMHTVGNNVHIIQKLFFINDEVNELTINRNIKFKNNKVFSGSYLENKDDILFVSDIRSTSSTKTHEECVFDDMNLQKNIILQLKPNSFFLKFRIPYTMKSINYLDGELFVQPFNKVSSTECRLMGEDLTSRVWELEKHEDTLFYINTVLREWASYNVLKVKGGDSCFDCALEQKVVTLYLTKYNSNLFIDPILETNIINMRNWMTKIHDVFMELNKKDHGRLPIIRSVDEFLSFKDSISIVKTMLSNYTIMPDKYKDQLDNLLKTNESLILKVKTYGSPIHNVLKIYGKTILNLFIVNYCMRNSLELLQVNEIIQYDLIEDVLNDFITQKLDIASLVSFDEEKYNMETVCKEMVLSLLGCIHEIYDNEYGEGTGHIICKRLCTFIISNSKLMENDELVLYKGTSKNKIRDIYIKMGWNFESSYKYIIKDDSNCEQEFIFTLNVPIEKNLLLESKPVGKKKDFKQIEEDVCLKFLRVLEEKEVIKPFPDTVVRFKPEVYLP